MLERNIEFIIKNYQNLDLLVLLVVFYLHSWADAWIALIASICENNMRLKKIICNPLHCWGYNVKGFFCFSHFLLALWQDFLLLGQYINSCVLYAAFTLFLLLEFEAERNAEPCECTLPTLPKITGVARPHFGAKSVSPATEAHLGEVHMMECTLFLSKLAAE